VSLPSGAFLHSKMGMGKQYRLKQGILVSLPSGAFLHSKMGIGVQYHPKQGILVSLPSGALASKFYLTVSLHEEF